MAIPIFPTFRGLTYPIKRRPMWNTLRHQAMSGKTATLQMYSFPLWGWTLPFSFLRTDLAYLEQQTLLGFINSVGSAAALFQWNDADDNAVTAQLLGQGDGNTTDFQLIRAYGGFVEPVFSPVGVPQVFDNGVALTVNVDFTVGTYGLITFTVAPPAGDILTWTGSYGWLCRFDDDAIELSQFVTGFWDAQKIAFTSQKP